MEIKPKKVGKEHYTDCEEIYRILQVIMEERNEKQFQSLLAGFKTKWEHQYPQFMHYFETHYSSRAGNYKVMHACI